MCQGVRAVGAGQVVEAREALLVATISDGDVHQPALVDLIVVHRVDPAHPKGPDTALYIAPSCQASLRSRQNSVSSAASQASDPGM